MFNSNSSSQDYGLGEVASVSNDQETVAGNVVESGGGTSPGNNGKKNQKQVSSTYSGLPEDLVALAARLESLSGGIGGSGQVKEGDEEQDGERTERELGGSLTRVAEVEIIARIKNMLKDEVEFSGAQDFGYSKKAVEQQKKKEKKHQQPISQNVWVENGRDVVLRKVVEYDQSQTKCFKYRCTTALPHNASNSDVSHLLAPKIVNQWVKQGFNVSVISLGKSNTGKTYSLFGNELQLSSTSSSSSSSSSSFSPLPPFAFPSETKDALLWNVLKLLFDYKFVSKDEISVAVSCFEVNYEDQIIDLLEKKSESNQRSNADLKKTYCTVSCANLDSAIEIINLAWKRSENWDNGTKRSKPGVAHSFVRVLYANHQQRLVGSVHFVDLVGSRSPIAKPSESKFKEAQRTALNLQLLGVQKLIREISSSGFNRSVHVPSSRSSKLTQVIGPLLATNTKCFILVGLSNDASDFAENQAALLQANSASLINTACMRCINKDLSRMYMIPFERAKQSLIGGESQTQYKKANYEEAETSRGREENQSKEVHAEVELRQPRNKEKQQQQQPRHHQPKIPLIIESPKRTAVIRKSKTRMRARHDLETTKDKKVVSKDNSKVIALKTKIKQLQRELDEADSEFQKRSSTLRNENQKLESWCDRMQQGSSVGNLFSIFEKDRKDARLRLDECMKLATRVSTKLALMETVLDPVEFVRFRIKSLRKEVSRLEGEMKTLRIKNTQLDRRNRFFSQISEDLGKQMELGRATDQEIVSNSQEIAEMEKQVKELELEEYDALKSKEIALQDRIATSEQIMLMRKFLSNVENLEERQAILNQLEKGTSQLPLCPEGSGVSKSILVLLHRLESIVSRHAPYLSGRTCKIRSLAEKMGSQLVHSQHRTNQLKVALESDLL